MKRIFLWLIDLYRKYISPLKKRPCCRFYPTCSTYAYEPISEWGAIRGLFLTVWRILRCNPFCRGGIDNVPKRGAFRKMTAERITYRGRSKELKNENSDKI
jgi:putative membrane protein insertion efficiency factor